MDKASNTAALRAKTQGRHAIAQLEKNFKKSRADSHAARKNLIAQSKNLELLNDKLDRMDQRSVEMSSLLGGLTNSFSPGLQAPTLAPAKPVTNTVKAAKVATKATKPAKVAAKPAKPAKVAKVAAVRVAKPAKVAKVAAAKVAKPAKVQSKAAAKTAKPAKAAKSVKVAAADRPPLRTIVQQLLTDGGAQTATDLRKQIESKYGAWSNTALHAVLKNFAKSGNGIKAQFSIPGDHGVNGEISVDEFVNSVNQDKSVSAMS